MKIKFLAAALLAALFLPSYSQNYEQGSNGNTNRFADMSRNQVLQASEDILNNAFTAERDFVIQRIKAGDQYYDNLDGIKKNIVSYNVLEANNMCGESLPQINGAKQLYGYIIPLIEWGGMNQAYITLTSFGANKNLDPRILDFLTDSVVPDRYSQCAQDYISRFAIGDFSTDE